MIIWEKIFCNYFLQKKWGNFWGKKISLNHSIKLIDFFWRHSLNFQNKKNGEIKTKNTCAKSQCIEKS